MRAREHAMSMRLRGVSIEVRIQTSAVKRRRFHTVPSCGRRIFIANPGTLLQMKPFSHVMQVHSIPRRAICDARRAASCAP
jgi:hypothetical protein